MIEPFYSSAYGPLPFAEGYSPGYEGPFLAGGKAFSFSFEAGSVVFQEIAGDGFTIQLYSFHFLKKTTLVGKLRKGLYSLSVHKGGGHCALAGKRARLREGQFVFCNGAEEEWKIEVLPEKTLQLLRMAYGQELTLDALPAFPLLVDVLSATKPNLVGPFSADSEIRDAVHKILYAAYEPYKLPFYFKAKVAECLFLLLNLAAGAPPEAKLVPTLWETEAIYKVRDFILANLSKHYTIPQLAKRFKISPQHLKVFFKREFGEGPYHFLLHARLDKVKKEMDSGKPMKEAAPEAGYLTTSFITAFKRRFGYPPGAVFRKKKSG